MGITSGVADEVSYVSCRTAIPLSAPSLHSHLFVPISIHRECVAMSTVASITISTPVPSSQVLNLPELLDRCIGDFAFAERCLVKFQQQLKADVERLQEAVNAGDTVEAARISHLIKGSAATVAATTLAERANAVEAAARQEVSCDAELVAATDVFVEEVQRFREVVPMLSQIG